MWLRTNNINHSRVKKYCFLYERFYVSNLHFAIETAGIDASALILLSQNLSLKLMKFALHFISQNHIQNMYVPTHLDCMCNTSRASIWFVATLWPLYIYCIKPCGLCICHTLSQPIAFCCCSFFRSLFSVQPKLLQLNIRKWTSLLQFLVRRVFLSIPTEEKTDWHWLTRCDSQMMDRKSNLYRSKYISNWLRKTHKEISPRMISISA